MRDRGGRSRRYAGLLALLLLPAVLTGACRSEGARNDATAEGERTAEATEDGGLRPGMSTPGSSSDLPTATTRSSFPLQIEDDADRSVLLAAPPARIVSLVPSATGILVALGEGDRLVARTDFDLSPEVSHLPSVGGGLGPSIERLVALDPDLVIRFRAESDPETPRQLDAAGIAHLAIRPDRIADVRRIIGMLGEAVGRPEAADSLWRSIDARLREVSDRVAGADPPTVVFLGGDPPSVAGPETFLHELIEIAGGENAFGDSEALYAPVSLEEVLRRRVDLILATEEGRVPQALREIPVARVPLEMLSPGVEMVESARTLAEIFHPDRFP